MCQSIATESKLYSYLFEETAHGRRFTRTVARTDQILRLLALSVRLGRRDRHRVQARQVGTRVARFSLANRARTLWWQSRGHACSGYWLQRRILVPRSASFRGSARPGNRPEANAHCAGGVGPGSVANQSKTGGVSADEHLRSGRRPDRAI